MEMKICGKCGPRPVTDFAWKNKATNKRQSWCKSCQKVYKDLHYADNKEIYVRKAKKQKKLEAGRKRQFILEYLLSHPCVDCHEPDIVVLEFDHQGDKLYSISRLIQDGSMTRLEQEIAKCEVVCCNCHRRRTSRQFGSWRLGAVV